MSVIFAVLMIALGLSAPYMQAKYAYTKPVAPDQRTGRTHEFNMRGKVVFLNDEEYLIATWTLKVAALAGLISGLLWVAADKAEGRVKKTEESGDN